MTNEQLQLFTQGFNELGQTVARIEDKLNQAMAASGLRRPAFGRPQCTALNPLENYMCNLEQKIDALLADAADRKARRERKKGRKR